MSGPFSQAIGQNAGHRAPASILRRPADGVSPVAATASDEEGTRKSVSVPVSFPRYQRKSRLNRALSVTESASEETGRSPQSLLSFRSRENLHVKHGRVTHTEAITYRAYACYRHGSAVHTQSIGYSSDGDLVLHRRDVSQPREGAPGSRGASVASLNRSAVSVEGAVCLNPRARAGDFLVDGQEPDAAWKQRASRMAKYPGVRCPKNRKIRNRLVNDHFASPGNRKLFQQAYDDPDPLGLREPAVPAFDSLPATLAWLSDTTEQQQADRLDRLGLGVDLHPAKGIYLKPSNAFNKGAAAKSIDSAAFRFLQLQARLKSELQHAMSTEYMPGFMATLEERIEALITEDAAGNGARTHIDVECRDGYGRLVAHGIAAFYKLQSETIATAPASRDAPKVTRISLPKKRVPLPDQRLTSYLRGERLEQPSTSSPCQQPSKPPAGRRSDDDGTDGEEDRQRHVLSRRKRFKRRTLRRVHPPAFLTQ